MNSLTLNSRAVPLLDRYEVNEVTGCWLWLGYVNKDGYARADGQNAHRLFYIEHVGAVPEDHDVDHLCKRRNCVNPSHLEAVTEAENMRRKSRTVTLAGRNFEICREGHLIRGQNVRIRRRNGKEYPNCWLCTRNPRGSTLYARGNAAMADAA